MELLNDMALFVEVAKARSFRGAAEIIGVPNSTLSRRVAHLERTIGLRLLHRTTRRIELTEAGLIYFERCRRIVDEARLAHEQLGGMLEQPSGLLRVSFPAEFATGYLLPIISDFAEAYPGITFDFELTERPIDPVSEPFDVVIQLGEPAISHLIARPLARLQPYLYSSPGYLEAREVLKHPSDLVRHACLYWMKDNVLKLGNGTEAAEISVTGRFRLNNVAMIRGLAARNKGIALLPEEVVADEVSQGKLVRVLPQWSGAPMPFFAVTETRLLPAKTQRFIEFLKSRLK
ncbi:LysR family transcriptional regulator (plasmid) [Agrobacterium tumefaciens]|uniref:HTH-type transcriptional regulator TtuA n=1 Tax=Agrobacterium tumefaciens TaxID=358 RepID=A0AAP9E9Y0_AGRTU|nr:LysR family transcriptional regulator [Agrobacterium tumefaciens]NSZ60025.1 LysR family transcriptional regulator [Agrobacterium tumefaciens]QDY97628.1 LysR family transcriptional regulator [Agrobacterium tumefaciens]UXS12752.1 LysR family transcriptional regulator [Agrobacterium tumefaciens]UXS20114.1 LysR family transcriptional regulator [Agrobacterium tumefaciens]UXS27761.1 LysR family transcriptional regulator [Agrobacterium tumefaciens]